MEILKLVGAIITLIGALFIFFASIGLLRMPDIYNRIQAGTKASTLGGILTLMGIGLIHIDWLPKILLLIIFVLISNPISSHVLARAAHYIKVPLSERTVIDKLNEDTENLKLEKPTDK